MREALGSRSPPLSSFSFSCLLQVGPHNGEMSSAGYRPRFGYDIRINAERSARPEPKAKRCAAPGCHEAAELSVPKSRHNMDERTWLCRFHLREHNARWDFFAGMSHEEIERF